MANKTIKYDSFKRGDTPVFAFRFTEPYNGFDWSTVSADAAVTDIESPSDNSGAGVYRSSIVPTVDGVTNQATYTVQPTPTESKALSPDTTYKVEIQLKDGGVTNVATPITGTVLVTQDYVI